MGLLEIVLLGLVAVFAAYFTGKSKGSAKEKQAAETKDLKRSNEIGKAVHEALKHSDRDIRPVNERLHSKGRLRD